MRSIHGQLIKLVDIGNHRHASLLQIYKLYNQLILISSWEILSTKGLLKIFP